MNQRSEDTTSAIKMKKFEKTQAAFTNRDYLDMDTDEEEFGIQETPEPEEEIELEPEKPIFTVQELTTLVGFVKDLTTLPSLVEADWSRDVIGIVEEYFINPSNTLLTIFSEKKKLKALCEFPCNSDGGLTYFLRSPGQIYTVDNFLSTIIFGSIDGNADKTILKMMENIYSPIAFRSDEWPTDTVVRNEIFSYLHEFLLCLTDVTYNPMGLTILYIPREGLRHDRKFFTKHTTDEGHDEEGDSTLERLERVARYWIKRIRETLKGASSLSSPWTTVDQEILHWHYRYENLSCVYQQLTNESVLWIVEKLESVRSASVQQYKPLTKEVEKMLGEANSNIKYLSLLEERIIQGFEIPDGIEDYATRILMIIQFIATVSPFYNSREKMEKICRAFCVQTVEHCREFIDLNIVLEGDADGGKRMLVKCIEACDKLNKIYDRLADIDENSDLPTISLVDKSKVFTQVDTLVNRCNDLIGIASARIAFDKCDEGIAIGGPKGLELGTRYRIIEERFNVDLSEIKSSRDTILDMTSSEWLKKIVKFRRGLKDIENMVKNWIDDIFNDVRNVEEGIEALHSTMRFTIRPYLRETLDDKWIAIWKILDDQLDERSEYTDKRGTIIPLFSGRANILRNNKMHLTKQHKLLVDASDWFGDCDAQQMGTRKYNRILAALSEKEDASFEEWQREIAAVDERMNLTSLSNQRILKYANYGKNDSIVANLKMFYLDNIKQVGEWTLLDYETKNILPKNCPTWITLRSRYNKVDYLCKMYNNIVVDGAITDRERYLSSILLNDLEEALKIGFTIITWNCDSLERFVTDCLELIGKMKESLLLYRRIDCKVDYYFHRIADTSLVNIDDKWMEFRDNWENIFEQQRIERMEMMEKNFEIIFQLLLNFQSQINADDEETAKNWKKYVSEMYDKTKISLTNCIRLSLFSFAEYFRNDENQLLRKQMNGIDVKQAERAIERLKATALEGAIPIRKWILFFDTRDVKIFLRSIERDHECINLTNKIKDLSVSSIDS